MINDQKTHIYHLFTKDPIVQMSFDKLQSIQKLYFFLQVSPLVKLRILQIRVALDGFTNWSKKCITELSNGWSLKSFVQWLVHFSLLQREIMIGWSLMTSLEINFAAAIPLLLQSCWLLPLPSKSSYKLELFSQPRLFDALLSASK